MILTLLQNRLAPLIVLALGIPILQWHAIVFWREAVGPITGWAWPVLLEVAALWLWARRRWHARALGLAVTLVLLAGPVHQVASPVLRELERAGRAEASVAGRVQELRAEIASLEASLATYRSNSESRFGWYGLITRTEAQLAGRREALRALLLAQGGARPARLPLQGWLTAALQLAAIVLFQALNVLAVVTLSRPPETAQTPAPRGISGGSETPEAGNAILPTVSVEMPETPETPEMVESKDPFETPFRSDRVEPPPGAPPGPVPHPPPAPQPPSTAGKGDEITVRRLQREIAQRIADSGLSAAEWCRRNGIRPADVSLLANHFERARNGKETVSARRLADLAARFLAPGYSEEAR